MSEESLRELIKDLDRRIRELEERVTGLDGGEEYKAYLNDQYEQWRKTWDKEDNKE